MEFRSFSAFSIVMGSPGLITEYTRRIASSFEISSCSAPSRENFSASRANQFRMMGECSDDSCSKSMRKTSFTPAWTSSSTSWGCTLSPAL